MRYLLRFLRPYIREAVLAPLFKLTEATLELFVPIVMTAIIDRGIDGGDDGFILSMGAVLAGIAVINVVIAVTAQYFAARAAVFFANDVKRALFSHVLRLSSESIDGVGSATLITRMTNDMNQVTSGVNLFLRLLLRSPFVIAGATVMAFTIDPGTALIFVAQIPVLALIVWFLLRITIPGYRDVQKKLDKVLLKIRENLSGVFVIRAFRRQKKEEELFSAANNDVYESQMKVGGISAFLNPATLIVINLGMLILVYIGAVRVESGELTKGQIVAMINYMTLILLELVKLANMIITVNRGLACADRVREVFEYPEKTDGGEKINETNDVIMCKNVSLKYPGSPEEALSDISFEIKKGETLGIIGGTGSGKSSLASLFLKFYEPTGGELLFFGQDIVRLSTDEVRALTGFVPQKSVLFKGTVRDNLLRGRADATDAELWEALKLAQAEEFVRDKDGLDTGVEQEGANFSGGQRQRLCIARALVRLSGRGAADSQETVRKPAGIFVADDSFSALDNSTERSLREGLKEFFADSDVICVIVSQRISSVKDADRILVLEDGKMAGLGTHGELMETCEVYREIAAVQ
ncbi:MAG: ABC transporter ATP-binding protein [Eubacterium sp.]|nr:ABC transporter ATP-binding protein [Eubacterium sp.]